LLLLTQARQAARVDVAGQLVLLEDQDRSVWDRSLISEGLALVQEALGWPAGRFGLMAAIAAVHAEAERWEDTDWQEILGLYDLLLARWPSPVVALNRVVALSYVDGPEAALRELGSLADDPTLATYPYLASTRAELLRRTGNWTEAVAAYEEALAFTSNGVEADFLVRRITRGA
jgi:RNA polymerase sigma-70 factor (ECF subfamily)